MTRFQPKPGRHDLMKGRVPKGRVAMRNTVTDEVVIVAAGGPELAALRRERHPTIWHQFLWQQVATPTRGHRAG